jgi:hypothetical protein
LIRRVFGRGLRVDFGRRSRLAGGGSRDFVVVVVFRVSEPGDEPGDGESAEEGGRQLEPVVVMELEFR